MQTDIDARAKAYKTEFFIFIVVLVFSFVSGLVYTALVLRDIQPHFLPAFFFGSWFVFMGYLAVKYKMSIRYGFEPITFNKYPNLFGTAYILIGAAILTIGVLLFLGILRV